MTRRQYRNYYYFFFFSSAVFTGFLINALINGEGWKRWISVLMFGVLIFTQLRVALLMRRKSLELDLK